jgi:hypothetical protein
MSVGLSRADRSSTSAGTDVRIYASMFVSVVAVVLLPALLSPRPLGVAKISLAFWGILAVLPLVAAGSRPVPFVLVASATIVSLAGPVVGFHLVRKLTSPSLGPESGRSASSV